MTEEKTSFQTSMREIRSMVQDCQDRAQGVRMYENLIQQAFVLSQRFNLSLKDRSDVRRTHDPRLRDARRKVGVREKVS